MRIAVLGAGSHSTNNHGPALQALKAKFGDEIELAAVCDVAASKAREFAGRFGFASVYDSVEAMFAYEKLDGVVAVTPIDLTGQVVGELLSHPVRLLLEKPPGKDSGEARQLLGIAYLASCRGGGGDPTFSRRIAEYALL